MSVCDITGGKVGTIVTVHRSNEPLDPAAAIVSDEILEVKTGLFGLGKHLYIPMNAVQEANEAGVFLSHPKERFESLGYYQKPTQIA